MPQFEIWVATRRVVSVAPVTRAVRTLPDRYVFGELTAVSDVHAVNGFWEGGVREYPSRVSAEGLPLAKSPLKKRMLRARRL